MRRQTEKRLPAHVSEAEGRSSPHDIEVPPMHAAGHQRANGERRVDQVNDKMAIIQLTAQTPAGGSGCINVY